MRGMPYKKASPSRDDRTVTNSYVEEALAKQAAARGPKSPPKAMPVTPTLPKAGKMRRRRRRTV
jgi:hypothetical protein